MSEFPSVTDADFGVAVLQAERPVIVDFWTPDCVVCRKLEPMLHKFLQAMAGQVEVFRMNPLENPAVASRYAVKGAPTLLLFKDGELRGRQAGFLTMTQLREWVRPVLTPAAPGREE